MVTDESGAVVAGVHITVGSPAGIEFTTRTDDLGAFSGTVKTKIISIELTADGFLKREVRDYRIPDSSVADLGIILMKVGEPIVDLAPLPERPIESRERRAPSEIKKTPLQAEADQTLYKPGGAVRTVLLTGVVYDPVGAIIPNIHVVAKDSKGRTFEGVTDKYGAYGLKLPFNPNPWKQGISIYEISAGGANSNFKRTVIRNLKVVSANDGTMRLDLVLEVMKMKVGPCRHGAICL